MLRLPAEERSVESKLPSKGRESAAEVVGRDAEIAVLTAALDTVGEGPFAIEFSGESGIGKTALWRTAVAAAAARSMHVLSCRPVETETKLAFAALGDLLGRVADEALPQLPEPQRHALEIALLRSTPDGAADQRTVSVAALAVVRHLAESAPVVLAVDDLQWIDASSGRLLQFVVRRLQDVRCGVFVSVLTPDRSRLSTGLMRALPPDRVRRVDVGPLSISELDRLLRTQLGVNLSRPHLVRIHRLSGGNPLFAQEIARAESERGQSRSLADRISIPESLRVMVGNRLTALPEDAGEVAFVCSALSHPTTALIRAASTSPRRSAEGLLRAVEAGVLAVDGERIRFVHPLLSSVVYGDASPEARRRLHARLATTVTEPEERARHLALAAAEPDAAVAAALDDAAARARSRGAPDAAAELSERAARLTPSEATPDRLRRLVGAARHLFEAGDTPRARTLLREVTEAAPPGPVRGEALRHLGLVISREESYAAAVAVFEEALLNTGDDVSLRAAVRRDIARAGLLFGDVRRAAVNARAALDLTEGLGDPVALSEALTAVAMADVMQGRGMPPGIMERVATLEIRSDALGAPSDAAGSVGVVLTWVDDVDAARERLETLHRLAREQGDEGSVPILLYHLSELESRAGNWRLAVRYAEEGLQAAIQTGQEALRAVLLYAAALVAAHMGRVEIARAQAEEGMLLAQRAGAPLFVVHNLSVLGFLELSIGEPGRAHAYLGPLADLVIGGELREPVLARFLPDEIEALATLGDLDRAHELLRQLEQRGAALDRVWALATAARCRGLLAAMEGDLPEAIASLEEALDQHARLAYPFARGRTLLMMGEVRRRAKQKRPAREALEEALEVFQRLGARLWETRARTELARIGGRAPGPAGLTPTERQVAELVTQGKTNREVAEALFMAVKTVNSNLSRIYHKLDVRSRTELAAKMAREASSAGRVT
jgi:DNA-binding CsgD family transcriptional regulator